MRIEMAAFYKTIGNYILLTPERYIVTKNNGNDMDV